MEEEEGLEPVDDILATVGASFHSSRESYYSVTLFVKTETSTHSASGARRVRRAFALCRQEMQWNSAAFEWQAESVSIQASFLTSNSGRCTLCTVTSTAQI